MRIITTYSSAAKWLRCLLAAALVSEACSRLSYHDYKRALRAKWRGQGIDTVKRCEDVIGHPHLFILWHSSPPQNSKRVMEALERSDGINIMEVHKMRFEPGAAGFAECHLNFYTNDSCGVQPLAGVSTHGADQEKLLRMKGDGPFTAVLYSLNCSETAFRGIGVQYSLNIRGQESEYLRTLKSSFRIPLPIAIKFSIHGTVNRLEAMIDIEALFGKGKYAELEAMARSGKRWDKKVSEHKDAICPTRRERPCEEVFESSYDLEIRQQAGL